jgi:hypothetical protein
MLLLIRITLIFFKLFYIFILEARVDPYFFSFYLLIQNFTVYFITFASLEYGYESFRSSKYKLGFLPIKVNEKVYGHIRGLTSIVIIELTFFVITYIVFYEEFKSQISLIELIMLLLILFLEVHNNEYYRYYQVNNIKLQIHSLITRNFFPQILFLISIYIYDFSNPILIYLLFQLIFSLISFVMFRLYLVSNCYSYLIPSIPNLSYFKNNFIGVLLVLLSSSYLYLDKLIYFDLLSSSVYNIYVISFMIGMIFCVIIQIVLIQPNLYEWYSQRNNGINKNILLFVIISPPFVYLIGISIDNLLIDYDFNIFENGNPFVSVIFGLYLYALSNIFSVYNYALRKDLVNLYIEILILIIAIMFLLLSNDHFIYYPMIIGATSFVCKFLYYINMESKN